MLRFTTCTIALAITGCIAQRGYPCTKTSQCDLDGAQGVCQDSGWCSYDDEDCASGQRYEQYAPGDLASACVEVAAETELSCEGYCQVYPTVCSGDLAIYPDPETCQRQCAQWPVGTIDDQEGDSLGCRQYHLTLAGMWNAAVNCARASPSGADVCRDEDPSICSQYCGLFIGACNTIPNVPTYASGDDCAQVCNGWYPGRSGADASTSLDSVTCRLARLLSLADDSLSMDERIGLCIAGSRTGGEGQDGLDPAATCTLPAL